MRRIVIYTGCACVLLARIPAAQAQRLSVQEPSLETFGVGTTVSVPDRGRTHVAGSRRSAVSRSSFGPVRSGTNMGLSEQAAGLSVGAYVHDLAEMDRRILAGAEKSRSVPAQTSLSERADRAYESLRTGAASRSVSDGVQSTTVGAASREKPASVQKAEGPSAERLLDRARQAESNGKRELALAFLRTARDLGSKEAKQEIQRLSPSSQ